MALSLVLAAPFACASQVEDDSKEEEKRAETDAGHGFSEEEEARRK